MITLSLAMIVKNEEAVLRRCLASISHIVDEIVIVDTGSTDGTKQIAGEFTQKIFDFKWVDDFSAARNFSFSKATGDYVMWLDADDYLTEEDQEKLLAVKINFDTGIDMAMLRYNLAFDALGRPTVTNFRERIMRRSFGYLWMEPVHECITPQGRVEQFEIAITHGEKVRKASDRNLRILEKQKTLSTRGRFYYARELKDHGRYQEAVVQYERLLEAGEAWREDNISACFEASYCYEMLGEKEKGIPFLLRTFLYDLPRSKACCLLGEYFIGKKDYASALYWCDLALQPNSQKEGGFVQKDYFGYLPHMHMVVIYDTLGQYEKAFWHHLKAKALKPEAECVLANIPYFAGLGFVEPAL